MPCVARAAVGGTVEAYAILRSLMVVTRFPVLAPSLRIAPRLRAVMVSARKYVVQAKGHHVSHHRIVTQHQHPCHGIHKCRVRGERLAEPLTGYGLLGNRRFRRHSSKGIPVSLRHFRAAPVTAVADVGEESGCGITAMSIILSGYGINNTPEDLRNTYYPVLNGENMSKELKSYGIDNTDFYFDDVHLSKESMSQHLKTNRPILICVWNKSYENRWTTSSHYMVLLAGDDDMVYISNPNGGKNDAKSSGWYKYKEIQPYIAKAMYIESD